MLYMAKLTNTTTNHDSNSISASTESKLVQPNPIKYNVLILEDEVAISRLLAIFLLREGCLITATESGEETILQYKLAKVQKKAFDIVILDLNVLHGMGGLQTFRQLQIINPNVCAIVTSGEYFDPIILNFETYGFKGALPKPFLAKTVIDLIKKLCP